MCPHTEGTLSHYVAGVLCNDEYRTGWPHHLFEPGSDLIHHDPATLSINIVCNGYTPICRALPSRSK